MLHWLLLAGLLAACADTEVEDDDNNGAADAQVDSRSRDIGGEPDATIEDVAQEPGPPDIPSQPDLTIDLVGECEPYTIVCSADGYSIVRCSQFGEWFEPSECDYDEVCEESASGAFCVDCTEGENCQEDPPVCDPGVNFCADFRTAAECTAEGRVGTTQGCGTGRCFGGGCHNTGNETGEMCENNAGCKGQTCICGSDYPTVNDEDLCPIDVVPGYCTTSDCHINGCDPSTEHCTDFSLSGAFGGGQVCLLRSNCENRLGSCQDGHRGETFTCRELPSSDWTGSRRTWDLACWVPLPEDHNAPCPSKDCISPIGGACTENADCIGGLCLHFDDVSYCAAQCDETHECPSYASCVRPDPEGDAYFCLANANNDDCPRLPNFNIHGRSFPEIGGVSTAQVCYVDE